jgi:hypothetical protein
MSDGPDVETSTGQHTILRRDKTSMPPEGFEPTIRASERPRGSALVLQYCTKIHLKPFMVRILFWICSNKYDTAYFGSYT